MRLCWQQADAEAKATGGLPRGAISALAMHPGAVLVQGPPYRARMVREPRTLLAGMGCPLPGDVQIRVWDSSAEVRYLVLPERPPGTEGMTEAELAGLVTRDSMIGVARL